MFRLTALAIGHGPRHCREFCARPTCSARRNKRPASDRRLAASAKRTAFRCRRRSDDAEDAVPSARDQHTASGLRRAADGDRRLRKRVERSPAACASADEATICTPCSLVSALEPARDIHHRADHGRRGGAAVADAAEHQRSDMQADADLERRGELVAELAVQPLEGRVDRASPRGAPRGRRPRSAGSARRAPSARRRDICRSSRPTPVTAPPTSAKKRFEQEHRVVGEARVARAR